MKIAILTQPLGHNYGGLLQAFALQRFLKDRGHAVETFDRRMPVRVGTSVLRLGADVAKLALGRIKTIPTRPTLERMYQELIDFRERRISLSARIVSESQLREYAREAAFEAYIVGSDQVWRPRYSPSIENYFLNFLDGIGSSARRLSYAASFGVDKWEFTPSETERCKALLAEFDAVSVRESSGVRLCQDHLGRTPELVLDPTLLVDRTVYEDLAAGQDSLCEGGVLVYLLDRRGSSNLVVKRAVDALGGRSFSVMPPKNLVDVRRSDFDACVYRPVESWLRGFMDASFVVTDSFHGTLFAIIFNKPFLAIGNRARGVTRFESILRLIGLEERLVEGPEGVTSELLKTPIDWERVATVLNEKRALSEAFLCTGLGG